MSAIKKSIRSVVVFLLVVLVAFLSSCVSQENVSKVTVGNIKTNHGQSIFRTYEKQTAERVLSGGDTSLYFDKKSGAICFYNNKTSSGFSSLPEFSNSYAASFIVSVFDGENIRYLDTSLHCAQNKDIDSVASDNTLMVTYNIKDGEISLSLPVKFTLNGTCIEVSITLSECEISEGATLLGISVLPYLGAVSYENTEFDFSSFEDFYLVPDGAGALIYTGLEDENKSICYSVYGKDYIEEYTPADVGAYGIKQGNNALAVTVTGGSEASLIRLYRSNADSERINRIYSEFIITPVSGFTGKIKMGESFNGEIAVNYELLSGDNADYIGIATSVRQSLIREGLLKSDTVQDEYPLFVRVTGSVDGSKGETVTSFQQAENLLNLLKSKGINNVNMILEGAFSEGVADDAFDGIRVSSHVGSKKDLNALLTYATTQKLKVYAGINFLTANGFAGFAKNISDSKNEVVVSNELYPYIGEKSFSLSFIEGDRLSSSVNNTVRLISEYSFYGVNIIDSGNAVFGDCSGKDNCYISYSEKLQSVLSALCAKTDVMLNGTSFNVIKNADYLNNVSLASVNKGDALKEIPFIPAVLHGTVIYSGISANTENFPRIQILKCVEYGAAFSYLWNFSEDSDKYYENSLADAVDFYLRAEKDLASLASKRITDHFLYTDGVYYTGYENGTGIYVNYNNYSVVIGEVSVMPYDYLRIG